MASVLFGISFPPLSHGDFSRAEMARTLRAGAVGIQALPRMRAYAMRGRRWTVDGDMVNCRIKIATSGRTPVSREDFAEMAEPARAKPKPTPETQHFWDGTKAGELRLQRCDACAQRLFPAAAVLPVLRLAQGQRVQGERQGRALQLRHQSSPAAPGFTPPYAIAVVEARRGSAHDEQHRRLPADAGGAALDMKLEVAFEKLDDKITLPLFRPAKG